MDTVLGDCAMICQLIGPTSLLVGSQIKLLIVRFAALSVHVFRVNSTGEFHELSAASIVRKLTSSTNASLMVIVIIFSTLLSPP